MTLIPFSHRHYIYCYRGSASIFRADHIIDLRQAYTEKYFTAANFQTDAVETLL